MVNAIYQEMKNRIDGDESVEELFSINSEVISDLFGLRAN